MSTGVAMIEDSAQWFPLEHGADVWAGDLVVLSFGRGKPVSLLTGGALLVRDTSWTDKLKPWDRSRGRGRGDAAYRVKVGLYNACLNEFLYGVLDRLPFLRLGETVYNPLAEVGGFPGGPLSMLGHNIKAYQQRTRNTQEWLRAMLASVESAPILDLPRVCAVGRGQPLLRYPLLVRGGRRRDNVLGALANAGLGATAFYRTILPEIRGLADILADQGPFPNACRFAESLLTLPTHSRVSRQHVEAMGKEFRDAIERE